MRTDLTERDLEFLEKMIRAYESGQLSISCSRDFSEEDFIAALRKKLQAHSPTSTMEWRCIICEQPMKMDPMATGDDSRGCWPCVEGGTIKINFGWFSGHDDLNIHRIWKSWQTCICDSCFDKKKHLCRHVKVIPRSNRWEVIKENEDAEPETTVRSDSGAREKEVEGC